MSDSKSTLASTTIPAIRFALCEVDDQEPGVSPPAIKVTSSAEEAVEWLSAPMSCGRWWHAVQVLFPDGVEMLFEGSWSYSDFQDRFFKTCPQCEGAGYEVLEGATHGSGVNGDEFSCPTCRGRGKVPK